MSITVTTERQFETTYDAKEPLMVAEEMKYMTDRRQGLNGNKNG